MASVRAALVSITAILLTAGCGGDDTGGAINPATGPGAAGAFPAVAGTGSGFAGTGTTGIAGRGAAGTTPISGLAGRSGGAAGSGVAGSTAAGSGVAGAGIAGTGTGVVAAGSGAGGTAGSATTAGAGGAGGAPATGTGTCCPSGDCLCHGPDPMGLTTAKGPYQTMSAPITTGTVYYPTGDAAPPFAAVVLCGGFLNTGPEMEAWAPLYASYGIVTVIVTTTGADLPDLRATKLLAAVDELEMMNKGTSGPLAGKLSGRYGTSGYSMGGGGTTIASGSRATLKTSVGLAPWGGVGEGVKVPTLLLCGDADTVAPCDMAEGVYGGIPDATPKMIIQIAGGVTHFNWFGPTDAGGGTSGKYALAFQKVYLEGDERWKPLLLMKPQGGSYETNIK